MPSVIGQTENQQVSRQHCPPRVLTLKSVRQLVSYTYTRQKIRTLLAQ